MRERERRDRERERGVLVGAKMANGAALFQPIIFPWGQKEKRKK